MRSSAAGFADRAGRISFLSISEPSSGPGRRARAMIASRKWRRARSLAGEFFAIYLDGLRLAGSFAMGNSRAISVDLLDLREDDGRISALGSEQSGRSQGELVSDLAARAIAEQCLEADRQIENRVVLGVVEHRGAEPAGREGKALALTQRLVNLGDLGELVGSDRSFLSDPAVLVELFRVAAGGSTLNDRVRCRIQCQAQPSGNRSVSA